MLQENVLKQEEKCDFEPTGVHYKPTQPKLTVNQLLLPFWIRTRRVLFYFVLRRHLIFILLFVRVLMLSPISKVTGDEILKEIPFPSLKPARVVALNKEYYHSMELSLLSHWFRDHHLT